MKCYECQYKDTRIANFKNHAESRHKRVQATLIDCMSSKNSIEVSSKVQWHTDL